MRATDREITLANQLGYCRRHLRQIVDGNAPLDQVKQHAVLMLMEIEPTLDAKPADDVFTAPRVLGADVVNQICAHDHRRAARSLDRLERSDVAE